MNTIYKCFGVVLQDEELIPDKVKGFVSDLFGKEVSVEIGYRNAKMRRLIDSGVVWTVYNEHADTQPTLFGLVLGSYYVNMRGVQRLVGGCPHELSYDDLQCIEKWESGPAAQHLKLLAKHGLELQICWLVGD